MSELRDLLERFRRGAELLAVSTTGAAGPELDYAPSDSEWTVRQIACHLSDAEISLSFRFRQLVAEPDPVMVAFDERLWTQNLGYGKRKISQAIETFRRLRSENHELLKDLPEEAFERAGNHTVRGRLTMLELLRMGAEHAENHVRQIQRVRSAYKEHKAKAGSG